MAKAFISDDHRGWLEIDTPIVVAGIAEARNLDRRLLSAGIPILVMSYADENWHGGVKYLWDGADTTADNAGTVLQLSDMGIGRLLMAAPTDSYNPRWFGAAFDNSSDDKVPIQRCFDQVPDGATVKMPPGLTAFVTDQLDWNCSNGRLLGHGYSRSILPASIRCGFDDPSKFLVKNILRSVISGLVVDLDGNTTTGLGQATSQPMQLSYCAVLECGGHGIDLRGVGGSSVDHCLLEGKPGGSIQSYVEPGDGGTIGSAGGGIGIIGTSDVIITNNEIAAGFHYGGLMRGTRWRCIGNHWEQCKIGLVVAGNTGELVGNRYAFGWSAGLMIGTGHHTHIGAIDVTDQIPKQITCTGNSYHNCGEDRSGSNDNKAGRALFLNDRNGTPRGKFFFSNENIVGSDSASGVTPATEFAVVVAGTNLREAHFVGGKIGQVNSTESGGFGTGGALMYADTATAWAATTAYVEGNLVIKTIDSVSHCFRCMTAGTSGSTGPVGTDYDAETDGTVVWAHLGKRINDSNSHIEFTGVSFDDTDGLLQCRYRQVEGGAETQRAIAHPNSGINTQTGSAYTLVRTDADSDGGETIVRNNASANTTTIPPDADVDWLLGDEFSVFCLGAGTTTMTPGTGVTILGTATIAQNAAGRFRRISANTWARISS